MIFLVYRSLGRVKQMMERVEAMNIMRKSQVKRLAGNDAHGQAKFVASLFQIAS